MADLWREAGAARGADGGDRRSAQILNLPDCPTKVLQRPADMVDQYLARRRQPQPTMETVKNRTAQLGFKRQDLTVDRGRGNVSFTDALRIDPARATSSR